MTRSPSIIYTWTDEAPYLATHAFLPVIRAFAGATGVPVETRDISLSGRILAVFADALEVDRVAPDDLSELGALVEAPEANVIKLLDGMSGQLRRGRYPSDDTARKGAAVLRAVADDLDV